jgi:zinc protease
VKKFYQDFYGAGHVEIAVVGDFDEAAVAPLVEELFGGWKSRIPFEFVRDVYFDVPAMNQTIATPDKANAYFTTAMNLKISDKDPDFPALTLGNYILGGGFLNSRLATRIRQKEGLSYGLGSRLIADQVEQAGQFRALAIVAPENVAKLETIFQEELARLLKNGVTPEEVAAAKSGWLQSRQVGRNQDGALANKLRDYLFLNRTLLFDEAFEKRVGELTAAEVNAALRKHIIPAKLATYKAGDFSKVTK